MTVHTCPHLPSPQSNCPHPFTPLQDIVIPTLLTLPQMRKVGLRWSPLHPLNLDAREGMQRPLTLFFAGRICGDRCEEWSKELALISSVEVATPAYTEVWKCMDIQVGASFGHLAKLRGGAGVFQWTGVEGCGQDSRTTTPYVICPRSYRLPSLLLSLEPRPPLSGPTARPLPSLQPVGVHGDHPHGPLGQVCGGVIHVKIDV